MSTEHHWKTALVTVKGTSHQKTDSPCQDYCVAHRTKNFTILALSDGAGSCKLSHIGSRAACLGFIRGTKTLLRSYQNDPDALGRFLSESSEDSWLTVLDCAAQFVVAAAEKRDTNPEESMACTLLGAIIGQSCAIVLQVGDGAWVAETESSGFHPVTWPEHGQYVNETYFITHAGYSEHLQFKVIPNNGLLRSLIGFSDGIERLCLDLSEKTAVGGFFRPLRSLFERQSKVEFEQGFSRFLKSERVTSLTDDDTSIIIASRVCNLQ